MNNNTQFELNVFPPFYSELNKPLPEDFPKPNVGCGIHTNLANGFVFSWIVSPEEAMIYDDVLGLIDALHESMDENTGIIEVDAGQQSKTTINTYMQ